MYEVVTNPYTGEVLSVVSETIEKFGITAEKLTAFIQSEVWSNTINDLKTIVDYVIFDNCLEQWLENN